MNELRNELNKSLQTGFIDRFFHSKNVYRPQLLINVALNNSHVAVTGA